MLMILLLLAGLLVFMAGGLMLFIAAFTVSIWWGILCFLVPPFLILFVVLNWAKAKKPLLVLFVGVVLVIAAAGMMGQSLVSSLRSHPFSSYKQYTWSATTITPRTMNSGRCDGRTRCSQMTSCEEAMFFLDNCPNTQMDGNHDGVPCESQWCKD